MITVSAADQQMLEDLVHRGQTKARVLTRAHILLQSAKGWSVAQIAEASHVCQATVYNTWHRYQDGGVARVVTDLPPTPPERALDAAGEAVLIALACSAVPDGHDHWTLRMLRDKVIELGVVDGISASTVHATLKKTHSNRGDGSTGASPKLMRRL